MENCKPSKKSPTGKVDTTSISSILNAILGVFDLMKKPATTIPTPVVWLGAKFASGMSERNAKANAFAEIDGEIGIPMGDVFADGPNRTAGMVGKVLDKGIQEVRNGKIQGAFGPGDIQVQIGPTGTGSNINIGGVDSTIT